MRHGALGVGWWVLGVGCLVLSSTAVGQEISIKTLLRDMTDMERLSHRPNPAYTEAQASSYDRNAISPTQDWFANGDYGKYIRTEVRNGRTEHVMADLKGPGTVVRIWSANPSGIVRFYFDGEAEPRFSSDFSLLLQGKHPLYPDPFAYNASNGCNLYFPWPYMKSLKVTMDESAGDKYRGVYYHVNYRTYPYGTKVTTWTEAQASEVRNDMTGIGAALLDPGLINLSKRAPLWVKSSRALSPFASLSLDATGSGAIFELRVRAQVPNSPANLIDLPWDNPNHEHNALRKARLIAIFDGEKCIDVPLCDFFGSSPGVTAFKTLPLEMTQDGWMICRFTMPYKQSCKISVRNDNPVALAVDMEARVGKYVFDGGSYLFHAQWTADRLSSRPMRDMNYLDVRGEGRWVGSMLHIHNPNATWWGEGDEKIYVNGEKFPSTFGTGSEDYYGYAWSSPTLFQRPYHAQPRCDGPGTQGHDCVERFHIFDDIPYTRQFRFDLELWHWAECVVDFDRVAYWYALPGGPSIREVNTARIPPTPYEKPKPVKGAIEGERMKILQKGGGETEVQGFGELSNGEQLWWRDPQPGQKLRLEISVKEGGTYEVIGNFCMAGDYGIHTIKIAGKSIGGQIDFYSATLKWEKKSLGTLTLPSGDLVVEVECIGRNAKALPRNMFGLDYLLLLKK